MSTTEGNLSNGGTAEKTQPKKIKSIVLTSTGSGNDYSNLPVKEEDYPKIDREDQVIVRIKAAGLNFAELMQRQNLYKPSIKTPYTPGYEASGIVEEVGSDVTNFKVNDRVIVFMEAEYGRR
jgi:NADPH:quinone reductase-like Zn-dependent oxidoreductase